MSKPKCDIIIDGPWMRPDPEVRLPRAHRRYSSDERQLMVHRPSMLHRVKRVFNRKRRARKV